MGIQCILHCHTICRNLRSLPSTVTAVCGLFILGPKTGSKSLLVLAIVFKCLHTSNIWLWLLIRFLRLQRFNSYCDVCLITWRVRWTCGWASMYRWLFARPKRFVLRYNFNKESHLSLYASTRFLISNVFKRATSMCSLPRDGAANRSANLPECFERRHWVVHEF